MFAEQILIYELVATKVVFCSTLLETAVHHASLQVNGYVVDGAGIFLRGPNACSLW